MGALDNKCIVWLSTTLIAALVFEFLLSSLAKYLAPGKKEKKCKFYQYDLKICILLSLALVQSWVSLGRFLGSKWDRQLKFSAYAFFWFRRASQNLSLFRQLFFHSFQGGGPKEKCWKIAITIHWFFSIFPLVPPWKLWKKLSK